SLCVVRKENPEANLIGARIFSGTIDNVAKIDPSVRPRQEPGEWSNKRRGEIATSDIFDREAALRVENDRLRRSFSWRITSPLRFCSCALQCLVRALRSFLSRSSVPPVS